MRNGYGGTLKAGMQLIIGKRERGVWRRRWVGMTRHRVHRVTELTSPLSSIWAVLGWAGLSYKGLGWASLGWARLG